MIARRLLVVLVLSAVAALALPAAANAYNAQAAGAHDPNPLLGQKWFVDWRDQPSAILYRRYRHEGQPGTAALMYKIASQPIFR